MSESRNWEVFAFTPLVFEDRFMGAGVVSKAEVNFGAVDLEVGFVLGIEKPSAGPIRRARFFGVSVSESLTKYGGLSILPLRKKVPRTYPSFRFDI
jgi:hypothetical protein